MKRFIYPVTLIMVFTISVFTVWSQEVPARGESSQGLAPEGNAAVWTPGTPLPKFPGDKAYAYNAFSSTSVLPVGPLYFNLNNPIAPVSLANQGTQDFIAAASWANGVWYGATYNANNGSSLVRIDTATGNRTVIGLIGLSITGMAYDWISNTMYALAYVGTSCRLYTLDTTSGQASIVAMVGGFLGICLGCDNNGVLYTVNTGTDNLVAINKTTGGFTVVGPIGFNANYAQDMEFDNSDFTMYYAAYRDSVGGQLRTVNLTTGATTLIGAFNGNMEVTGFAIRNEPIFVGLSEPSVPRISIKPNPVIDYFEVSTGSSAILKLSLYTASGLQVMELRPARPNVRIDLAGYSRGLYLVRAETKEGVQTRRIILE
ncbi:MAG TPA: T9SS type A sorting domain-containing protein [Bacteroidales bacterium]|nr:T9SS type A sorting domain-containing protein [Bacteroidales bacterium]HSA42975.1 T9SS type A sorting domain-containing protein [Bacteroidales bacterium]